MSPNIGTPTQEHFLRLKSDSTNIPSSSKNNFPATPTKPTEVTQSDPALKQRTPADNPTSSDDVIALLTQEGSYIIMYKPGHIYAILRHMSVRSKFNMINHMINHV